uniref:uncharacterized protein n=1 Tax=Myxine glutinosa TaxID=7769 RepID=UPI003590046C
MTWRSSKVLSLKELSGFLFSTKFWKNYQLNNPSRKSALSLHTTSNRLSKQGSRGKVKTFNIEWIMYLVYLACLYSADVDECALNNGGCDGSCCNTIGGFYCKCPEGSAVASNGYSCEDVDECTDHNGGCQQRCVNTPGSYHCECHSGSRLHSDAQTCLPTHPCSINNGGCQHLCEPLDSSHYECRCRLGYKLAINGMHCEVENPCVGNGNCQHGCVSDSGSAHCICNAGYTLRDDKRTCEDIDECADGKAGCTHECQNTVGSFMCRCQSGYDLGVDGKQCYRIDIEIVDSCAFDNGGCEHRCTHTRQGPRCSCHPGFHLHDGGKACQELVDSACSDHWNDIPALYVYYLSIIPVISVCLNGHPRTGNALVSIILVQTKKGQKLYEGKLIIVVAQPRVDDSTRHHLLTGWLLAPYRSSSALCQVLLLVLAGCHDDIESAGAMMALPFYGWYTQKTPAYPKSPSPLAKPMRGVGLVADNSTMRQVALGYMLLTSAFKKHSNMRQSIMGNYMNNIMNDMRNVSREVSFEDVKFRWTVQQFYNSNKAITVPGAATQLLYNCSFPIPSPDAADSDETVVVSLYSYYFVCSMWVLIASSLGAHDVLVHCNDGYKMKHFILVWSKHVLYKIQYTESEVTIPFQGFRSEQLFIQEIRFEKDEFLCLVKRPLCHEAQIGGVLHFCTSSSMSIFINVTSIIYYVNIMYCQALCVNVRDMSYVRLYATMTSNVWQYASRKENFISDPNWSEKLPNWQFLHLQPAQAQYIIPSSQLTSQRYSSFQPFMWHTEQILHGGAIHCLNILRLFEPEPEVKSTSLNGEESLKNQMKMLASGSRFSPKSKRFIVIRYCSNLSTKFPASFCFQHQTMQIIWKRETCLAFQAYKAFHCHLQFACPSFYIWGGGVGSRTSNSVQGSITVFYQCYEYINPLPEVLPCANGATLHLILFYAFYSCVNLSYPIIFSFPMLTQLDYVQLSFCRHPVSVVHQLSSGSLEPLQFKLAFMFLPNIEIFFLHSYRTHFDPDASRCWVSPSFCDLDFVVKLHMHTSLNSWNIPAVCIILLTRGSFASVCVRVSLVVNSIIRSFVLRAQFITELRTASNCSSFVVMFPKMAFKTFSWYLVIFLISTLFMPKSLGTDVSISNAVFSFLFLSTMSGRIALFSMFTLDVIIRSYICHVVCGIFNSHLFLEVFCKVPSRTFPHGRTISSRSPSRTPVIPFHKSVELFTYSANPAVVVYICMSVHVHVHMAADSTIRHFDSNFVQVEHIGEPVIYHNRHALPGWKGHSSLGYIDCSRSMVWSQEHEVCSFTKFLVERLPFGLSIRASTPFKTVEEQLAWQALARCLVNEYTHTPVGPAVPLFDFWSCLFPILCDNIPYKTQCQFVCLNRCLSPFIMRNYAFYLGIVHGRLQTEPQGRFTEAFLKITINTRQREVKFAARDVQHQQTCVPALFLNPSMIHPIKGINTYHMYNCFTDVDECLENNGGCEQLCSNVAGSFRCSCHHGYLLSPDGQSCLYNHIRLPQLLTDVPAAHTIGLTNAQTPSVVVGKPPSLHFEHWPPAQYHLIRESGGKNEADSVEYGLEGEDYVYQEHRQEHVLVKQFGEYLAPPCDLYVARKILYILVSLTEDNLSRIYSTIFSSLLFHCYFVVILEDPFYFSFSSPGVFVHGIKRPGYKGVYRVSDLFTARRKSFSKAGLRGGQSECPGVLPLIFFPFAAELQKFCVDDTFGPDCSLSCDDCSNGGECNKSKAGCDCAPGWTGLACNETCVQGFFGKDCMERCTCKNGAACEPALGKCLCPPGVYGAMCENGCPRGLYGKDCTKRCTCPHHGRCHRVHGGCLCDPGLYGRFCHLSCPRGTYGLGCSKECKCSRMNSTSCNSKNGSCHCKLGYEGPTCDEECRKGYFGPGCKQRCACTSDLHCHHITGLCRRTCPAGYHGPDCAQKCMQGYYGEDCQHQCACDGARCHAVSGHCICPAGKMGINCNEVCRAGKWGAGCMQRCTCRFALEDCDAKTGRCLCEAGYTGLHCDQVCEHGSYGPSCTLPCPCQNGAACDHVSGACNCTGGWTGMFCETPCPHGYFGLECQHSCTCGSAAQCDHVTGTCHCFPGWTGPTCKEPCPSGMYGEECSKVCECQNEASCDPVTGRCTCGPGWTGSSCQQACPPGLFGPLCLRACSCLHGASCKPTTGRCLCPQGRTGLSCDIECEHGKFGTDCQQTCHCLNDAWCDQKSGRCLCTAGWTGEDCGQLCPDGWYGPECKLPCLCDHATSCHHVKGACKCTAGWRGHHCDKPCLPGTYGENCSLTCSCSTDTPCHGVTGQCGCPRGLTGMSCEQTCPPGTYGQDCNAFCHCTSLREQCHPVTGHCFCLPGFHGEGCKLLCPVGHYGEACARECECENGRSCESATGQCICPPGFIGANCNESCPSGWYGVACKHTCTCAEGAICDPHSGSCHCLPGYMGPDCRQSCSEGTFGPDCQQNCSCYNNARCDNANGSCICGLGWTGPFCELECSLGTYGPNCAKSCNCGHNATCDRFTGCCLCPPGFYGPSCEHECPPGFFGRGCSLLCGCANRAACHPATGRCDCPAGFVGEQCENGCQPGFFGSRCEKKCDCESGAPCNPVSGKCLCPPGKAGPRCTKACGRGHYGPACSLRCRCGRGGHCDAESGLCHCLRSWVGPFCQHGGPLEQLKDFEEESVSLNIPPSS